MLGFVSRCWALTCLCATPVVAQLTVQVQDTAGNPIPFVWISVSSRDSRIADDSGRLTINIGRLSKLDLRARRLGYYQVDTSVATEGLRSVILTMRSLPRTLDAVTVQARPDDALWRAGFYDRLTRVQRGAVVGEFMTPEQLEQRSPSALSNALTGSRYATVRQVSSSARARNIVITGRGGCTMTILVDGVRTEGTTQNLNREDATSIDPRGTSQMGMGRNSRNDESSLLDVDQLVGGGEIAGIEVYPSAANAPVELQRLGGRGSCGIIAVWTGPRR